MNVLPVEDLSATCCVHIGPGGLSTLDAERVASLLKAVADPVRLRLFTRIAAGGDEVCVCDLPDVGVSQPTVSHHLRKLREAGVIDSERRGTWVFYRTTDLGRELARSVDSLAQPRSTLT